MPQMAPMTVKKADRTTNVVYDPMTPSTANTPAVFMAPALGAIAATRPEYRIGQTRRPDGTWKVTHSFMYPYHVVDSTTGVTTIVGRVMVTRRVEASGNVPQSVIDEAVYQSADLDNHSVAIESDRAGYGPT